jgi:hypothetical protein
MGQMPPGLRNKLITAGAWKDIEPKPVAEAQKSGEAPSGDPKPSPAGTETKANDGSK